MIKKAITFCVALLVLQGAIYSQTNMPIPNGSFEQWTSHPGYNVIVRGMSLPVYDTYSTPTGWGYLTYPVNESFSALGTPISISTSIPLVKVVEETGTVPDSNKAVKLQTFMLSDLVTGLVYTLAAPQLDTMLTQTVFPSILLTGEINMDSLMPIVTNLLTNIDSAGDMLVSLAGTDVNNLITGGIALGGFEPSRLTGSYKYHSAVSGDNGGVLMLGTHYNTTTHRREVVGGGLNIGLTDVANYTPFTVDYLSLHTLDSTFADQAPDSLIVLMVSSASENRQQGSYLCVDNLRLWHDSTGVELPDTCASIVALAATADIHEAVVAWNTTSAVDGYELEYGPTGFTQGSGTMLYPSTTTATLTSLVANTAYDVYVRTVCNGTTYGEWASASFTTQPDTCASVRWIEVVNVVYDAFPEYELQWWGTSEPDHWEVEYGLHGFELGQGTVLETNETNLYLFEMEQQGLLHPNTDYDFYVRSVCANGVYGEWDSVHYLTVCASVSQLAVVDDSVVVNADNLLEGYRIVWVDTTETEEWGVYIEGSSIGYYTVNDPYFDMPPLRPNTRYTVSVISHCGEQHYGDLRYVNFTTANVGIAEAEAASLLVSPNPANGRCVVSLADGKPAELKLYSTDGRLLSTLSYQGLPVELQLLSQGVFLLQVTTGTGTITRKIVNQ